MFKWIIFVVCIFIWLFNVKYGLKCFVLYNNIWKFELVFVIIYVLLEYKILFVNLLNSNVVK